jgi:V-type H+-transporting ATPase subunit H
VCIDTLQKGGNWFQITYRALNIIWLCSLSSPSNPLLLSKPLAQILADLLKREERKEKVIRMAVSILCNLSSQAKFLDMVLPLGILRSVQQNLLRVWSDTDVEDLLKSLQSKLQAHVDGKGTWDEYRKELLSGQLDWTPAHRSKAFWSENVNKFSDNDFMVLKSLIVILQSERLSSISFLFMQSVID